MTTLAPLPIYPSSHSRKSFSVSQLAQFHRNLSDALTQIIALPPAKRDTPPTRAFISSYANDAANQILESLIWENAEAAPQTVDHLRQRVLLLSEKLASSPPGLDLKTLLDLCVAFPSKITRLKAILAAALGGTPDLPSRFTSDVVSAFTTLLSPAHSSGLYGLRKTARCLVSLLRPSPPALVSPFAHDKEFILALARAYDSGLTAISRSYGGLRTSIANRELDHWERIWLDTKVDIIDAFHIMMTTMVQDVTSASGTQLAMEADRAFGIVFALLDVTPETTAAAAGDPVPFLNRSLVADYQHAYDLKRTLADALRRSSRDDARMELLESTLRSLDVESSGGNARDPGALKLILRSSGVAPGVSNKATPAPLPVSTDKGKAKATVPVPEPSSSHDPDFDLQVTQVLDIFPNHSPEYIRKLLIHPSYPFRGKAERVIEALLEGTAPDEDALGDHFTGDFSSGGAAGQGNTTLTDAPIERRNVFDDEVIDLSRLHTGKKTHDATTLNRDRAEVERMKAEILRLTEAMSDDSDEDDGPKALDLLDLDDGFEGADVGTVKVVGDGEDSGDEEATEERGKDPHKPETILELAYIRDPKLFDRDAQTRRSKGRADLKQQTGWTDEQIEGWRIMLERNPKKERILQKHEFSGNRIEEVPVAGGSAGGSRDQSTGGRDRGRGRGGGGRGRGRGRGRGGGEGGGGGRGGAGETSDSVTRDRAFKTKHKSQGRKRGHDKKMARAGAGPST